MVISARILQQAIDLYLRAAYPGGVPAEVEKRVGGIRTLAGEAEVPFAMLERDAGGAGSAEGGYVIRLGQPAYPFMKLAMDPVPTGGGGCQGQNFLLRVDAHDRHLHAAAGSPDAAWLASVRASNQELVEKIEGAWAGAGLPTFKEYLRGQLEARRKAKGE